MRTVVSIIGVLFAAGALALAILSCFPAAGVLALWAVILLVGLLIERWRYKKLTAAPPGLGWQTTGERFLDPETEKLVTVYFNPATGERRYIAP
jgi:predicted membrane metal-binding protein